MSYDALRVLLARCSVPFDHHVRGYFADTRGIGGRYGGFLLFVFECPFGVRGKDYGT